MINNDTPFFLMTPQKQELFLSLPLAEVEVLKRSCGHTLPRWVPVEANWYDMKKLNADLTPRMKLIIGNSYKVTYRRPDDCRLLTCGTMKLTRIDCSVINSPVYGFRSDSGIVDLTTHMIEFIKPDYKGDDNG